MTVNTSKYHLRKICKDCAKFYYDPSKKHKHQCAKYEESIYRITNCKKTSSLREAAVAQWRKERDEAFFALTGRCYNGN